MNFDRNKVKLEDLVAHGLSDAEARGVFVSIQQFLDNPEQRTPMEVVK